MYKQQVNIILTDMYDKMLNDHITDHLSFTPDERLSPGGVEKLIDELHKTGVFIRIKKHDNIKMHVKLPKRH